jgi:putative phage-type endonuclease
VAELIPTASEAEWLAARRRGVTASEIAGIMGLAPNSWESPYSLYHQKLGILPPPEQTEEQEVGQVLEPYIARKFAERHPEFAVLGDGRGLYAHSSRPWQLATPDQIVHELAEVDGCTCGQGPNGYYGAHERGCGWELGQPVAVAEFKTDGGSDEWGEPGTDEIPVHYRCQVLWQMDVLGLRRAYVACLGRDRKVREYVVEHAGQFTQGWCIGECKACEDIALMREAARDFLDRIDRKDPPDVDYRPATAYALKQLHPSVEEFDATIGDRLAANYRAAARNLKHWEQRKKLYEARIRQAIGPAHRAIVAGGEVVARRDVYEVRESVRKGYTVDKLVNVPPKKES